MVSEKKYFGKKYRIVPMELEDIQKVKQIEVSNDLSFWSQIDYINELSRQDSIGLVLKISEEIIGFVISRLITNSKLFQLSEQNQDDFCEIYNLAIMREFQGFGLGKILMKRFLEIVRENKISSVWLEVRQSNTRAIKLYRKFGFEQMYVRQNFYTVPTEDADVMCLKLDSPSKN